VGDPGATDPENDNLTPNPAFSAVQCSYLYINSFVIVTALAEQSMCDDMMDIQFVQCRVHILNASVRHAHESPGVNGSNLSQTCGEYYNFVNFTHLFQKIVHSWALGYVGVVPLILDFDWYNKIGLLDHLERGSLKNELL
jgi:hypothetical protein